FGELRERARVTRRQPRSAGHAFEAGGLRTLRVHVVRQRGAMIVQRHAELANDVGIRRPAQVIAREHTEAVAAVLLDEPELLQLLQEGAVRQIAGITFQQRLEAAALAVHRQRRRPAFIVEELSVDMPAGQDLRHSTGWRLRRLGLADQNVTDPRYFATTESRDHGYARVV